MGGAFVDCRAIVWTPARDSLQSKDAGTALQGARAEDVSHPEHFFALHFYVPSSRNSLCLIYQLFYLKFLITFAKLLQKTLYLLIPNPATVAPEVVKFL
jgi:hypothetical protein